MEDNVSKKSKNSNGATSQSPNSPTKMQARAHRFAREHGIESQKAAGSYTPPSSSEYSRHVNAPDSRGKKVDTVEYKDGRSRIKMQRQIPSGSPVEDQDEVEADSVRPCPLFASHRPRMALPQNLIDWDKYRIIGISQELFKPYLRITSVCFLSSALHFNSFLSPLVRILTGHK